MKTTLDYGGAGARRHQCLLMNAQARSEVRTSQLARMQATPGRLKQGWGGSNPCPHPNAARLLLSFFLDPEAQTLYGHTGRCITPSGVLENEQPELAAPLGAKRLGTLDPAREEKFIKLPIEIYGRA